LSGAALFSALTGIRHCDIQKLKWSEVEMFNGNYRLNFTQQKTKGVEYMPISEQAFQLCGERQDGDLLVFAGLPAPSWINRPIKRWVEAAGIKKHISFHMRSHSKFFYLLNISELSILKNVTANDLETSYILFLSQLCNIQRTL
jgi:integrase